MKLSISTFVFCMTFTLAAHAQDLPVITVPLDLPDGAVELEMVLIPAGSFIMGTPTNDPDRWTEEFPPHEVTITQPFLLGRYEVTQEHWSAVEDDTPARFDGLNRPIETISWERALEFIESLNEMDLGIGTFRLPTEAEWEYACLGGATTRFYWGDDRDFADLPDYMWYARNNEREGHQAVGLKLPNNFGLYDMAGNVYEMVQDDWDSGFERGPQVDPVIVDEDERRRVIKGGSYRSNEHRGRAAWRFYTFTSRRFREYGFRLAATPAPDVIQSLQTSVIDWSIHK